MKFIGDITTKKEVVYHLVFWLLLSYFTLVRFDRSYPFYLAIATPDLFSVSWTLVFVTTFYINYLFTLPRVFKDFSWLRAALGFLMGYLFFVGFRFFLEENLFPLLFNQSNYVEGTPVVYYLIDNLYYCTLPLVSSTVFWLIIYLIRQLQVRNLIIEENRNTEVKFLKGQLNPHFLFNTLNNIYSMVYLKSEKALPAIEKLSEIMRFTTYEIQKEIIELNDEIRYIKSFVELEQLRHNGEYYVNLEVSSEDLRLKLPPFLLSPLVENAVKHGITTQDTPLEVHLKLYPSSLEFCVVNVIGTQKKDLVGGIGLENLRRRLNLYFPDEHLLRLTEEDNRFRAHLEIFF